MPFEIGQRKRESVVDADERGDVPVEFPKEPFSKTAPRPVPARARRGLNLFRRADTLGSVNPESPATGVCGLRAGVVDADVADEVRQPVASR